MRGGDGRRGGALRHAVRAVPHTEHSAAAWAPRFLQEALLWSDEARFRRARNKLLEPEATKYRQLQLGAPRSHGENKRRKECSAPLPARQRLSLARVSAPRTSRHPSERG